MASRRHHGDRVANSRFKFADNGHCEDNNDGFITANVVNALLDIDDCAFSDLTSGNELGHLGSHDAGGSLKSIAYEDFVLDRTGLGLLG